MVTKINEIELCKIYIQNNMNNLKKKNYLHHVYTTYQHMKRRFIELKMNMSKQIYNNRMWNKQIYLENPLYALRLP